jgi:hypothetical protein
MKPTKPTTIEHFTNGKTPTQIYLGKNKGCRCGCRGSYAVPGTRQYENRLTVLGRMLAEGKAQMTDRQDVGYTAFINFAYDDDKAITLYFDSAR